MNRQDIAGMQNGIPSNRLVEHIHDKLILSSQSTAQASTLIADWPEELNPPLARITERSDALEIDFEELERSIEPIEWEELEEYLSIVDKVILWRREAAIERGETVSNDELSTLALNTLMELPLGWHQHMSAVIDYIANAIAKPGPTPPPSPPVVVRKDLKPARPNYLPEQLALEDEPIQSNSYSWGTRGLDMGPSVDTFDDVQAVVEDIRQLPAVGPALFSRDGRFRTKFYRSGWWTTVLGVFLFIAALPFLIMSHSKDEAASEISYSIDESHYAIPKDQKIYEALDGYLLAPIWQRQVDYVRFPLETAAKMQRVYAKAENRYQTVKSYELMAKTIEVLHGRTFVFCLVMIYPEERSRPLMVEVTEKGPYLIDWDYAEIYQEPTWSEFFNRTDSQPEEMLAVIQPGNYYNFDYADRDLYQCWELSDPAEEGPPMFGYAKRDSEVNQILNDLGNDREFGGVSPNFLATLKLAHPAINRDASQVVIQEVVQAGPLRR